MPRRASPSTRDLGLAAALADHARGLRRLARDALRDEPRLRALAGELDPDGFADTLAQTLACALFTARLLVPAGADLPPHSAAAALPRDPELDDLLRAALESPALRPQLDALADLLARAVLPGDPAADPVLHFYEHFLAAYDPQLRSRRGVFYTPLPVVTHLVDAVDDHLRREFGLADGLAADDTWADVAARLACELPPDTDPAAPFVTILDPAAGTATFLLVALERIARTLKARWSRELAVAVDDPAVLARWQAHVPTLLPRLVGHEVMPVPCTLARLRLALKLRETGYHAAPPPLKVLRTNGLAPPAAGPRFTVVVGNPPWSGHSVNNDLPWIVERVHDYRRGIPQLAKPGQAKWLQDDYVKFMRLAEWTVERSRVGVVGLVTSHGFLDNPTFRGLRRSLLATFDYLRVLDLHGNSLARERAAAHGRDDNVFAIQQGVAVSLLSRNPARAAPVRLRGDLWGERAAKLAALSAGAVAYAPIAPAPDLYLFTHDDPRLRAEYERGVPLHHAMAENGDPAPGIVTTHDEFAVAFTADEMRAKVEALLAARDEAEARAAFRLCTQSQWRFAAARRALADGAWRSAVAPLLYRPFDLRWTVFDPHVAVHRRERVMRHMLAGDNLALVTTRSVEGGRGFEHVFVTRHLAQHHAVSIKEVNYVFPLRLHTDAGARSNYSAAFVRRLSARLGHEPPPAAIFGYTCALLHSPTYRARYAALLRTDFPRILLPAGGRLFASLAEIGARLCALHTLSAPELADPAVDYTGPDDPTVDRVTFAGDAVAVARDARFSPVPPQAWDAHIGGSRICQRWLRDRKGRRLDAADRLHYRRIVAALALVAAVVPGIDAAIAAHGGWPDAFA